LGKLLESISKKKTVDKLSQLASLKVTKANLIESKDFKHLDLNSSDKEVPVELL
jgi:cation transport ATPase